MSHVRGEVRLRPCPNCGKLLPVKGDAGTVIPIFDKCPECDTDLRTE